MIWSDWVTQIADLLDTAATITNAASATPSTDANFNNILAAAVSYTENRIQRDLDLINTYVTNETPSFVANKRKQTIPTSNGTYVVVAQVYPIVNGVRQAPLCPVSWEFLNWSYPSDAGITVPLYWAPLDNVSFNVGPAPDQTYGFGVVGTQRFTPLSSTNISNFLTLQMPDIYIAASMVFLFGYQRDFGAQSDDPTTAQSWEHQYQLLMKPALIEEKRKMFASAGWSPRLPSPIATPPQT